MPNIKSAKKKVSVIARRKQENRYVKSTMATMIKNFREAVKTDVAKAEEMLKDIISYIDSAETKGVIHKNNASRKISRLNTLLFKAKNAENVVAEEKVEVVEEKVEAVEEKPAKKTTRKTTAKAKKEEK
ncbi:MAG: 30S ribosomal protein S20 [Clostridia bacterium]|nr:30S ribosomal protein S20 [Clostridia bacterium]